MKVGKYFVQDWDVGFVNFVRATYFLRKIQLRKEDGSFHGIIENEGSHEIRNDYIK